MSDLLFDYDSVSSSVATFLRGQAERIRRQCTGSVIQVGKALIESKRHLSHGGFLRWVEAEVGIPVRTAQGYMRVASWASGKCAIVAHLAPSALYLLSSDGVPEAYVVDVISRLEAGERIAPSAIREELKAFRPNARKEQKKSARSALSAHINASAAASKREHERAVAELIAVLMQGLSTADLERVRDIVASDEIASDPELGLSLKRAFDRETRYWGDARLAYPLTSLAT